ncbi:unnamed protein product [Ixodes hexagonus]
MSKLMAFSPPTGKSITERETMTSPRFLVAAVVCVSISIILVSIIIGVLRNSRRATEYCDTEGCRMHALNLKMAMSTSVNPCDNFYDFVCGSYRGSRDILTTSVQEDMALKVYKAIIETLLEGDPKSSVTRKLFQTCNAPTSSDSEDIRIFKEFKQRIGILWPEERQTFMHPLDLLLKLAIRWNFNFLVSVRVVPTSKRRNRTLLLSPGTITTSFQQPAVDTTSPTAFEEHVREYYRILGASPGTDLKELSATQRAILDVAEEIKHGVPKQVTIAVQSLRNFTPTVHPKDWLQFLNSYSQPDPPFGLKQIVIIEDARLVHNLGKLLKDYPAERLVIGIAWIFIQSYLWVASNTPIIRFGTASRVKLYRPIACLEFINFALGLLGAKEYLKPKLTKTVKTDVDGLVLNLTKALKSKILISDWIDIKTKLVAVDKLDEVQHDIWPVHDFFVGDTSSLFDSRLGNMTDSFIGNLVTVSERVRALINLKSFEAIHSKQIAPPSGFFSYLYYLNQVRITPIAIDAPLYYLDGTLAMKLGGLGMYIARQLVRTIDPLGTSFDEQGNAVNWVGHSTSSEYAARVTCNNTDVPVLPTVPALEMTIAALKQSIEEQNVALADFRLRGLKDYTEDQILFMTYCHGHCSASREASERECNAPLRQFVPFAKAFDCPTGAGMNPVRKCIFL